MRNCVSECVAECKEDKIDKIFLFDFERNWCILPIECSLLL